MTNQEPLKILKHGVGVWNEWTFRHPDMNINLRRIDLTDIYLREANLAGKYISS
jgi:hypothetical protein